MKEHFAIAAVAVDAAVVVVAVVAVAVVVALSGFAAFGEVVKFELTRLRQKM